MLTSVTILLVIFSIQGFNLLFDCTIPTSIAILNANAARVVLPHGGDFFWNGSSAGYGVAPSSMSFPEVKSIFAGGLWIGGYEGTALRIAASTDGLSNGKTDYYAGPLDYFTGTTTSEACENWDRFWEIRKWEIDLFRSDLSDGTIDDPIPPSIMEWPGRGNPHFLDLFGFEFPESNYDFAPFIDLNGDSVYDPLDGDYPDVKGADQAIYWVFNDFGNIHEESSNSQGVQIEVHALAYAYESNNEAINKTTFYDLKFISRSSTATLNDVYVGLWLDPSLGCGTDDYIGCNNESDMAYIYNMDAEDGEANCTCPEGVETFCEEIPMVGIKILEGLRYYYSTGPNGEIIIEESWGPNVDGIGYHGLSNFMYYNETGQTPSPAEGTESPVFDFHYYNLLTGKFKDGTVLTSSGDGYNTGSLDTVSHAFSGNPDNSSEWSMCSEDLPALERKMLLSSGPVTMSPGSINNLSFAVIHVSDVPHPCPSIEPLIEASEVITDLYNGVITSVDDDLSTSLLKIKASPNPFSLKTQLDFSNLSEEVEKVHLYNTSGQRLRTYDNINGKNFIIERENIESGIYFYEVITKKRKTISGKLIVQ